ncbi:MAG: alanyl-tRNA editing protein [Alphaproteobacteria bacterium]|nr:alanyl-tRNA editing protein [Alphaproteobacteria bacterium]
MTILVFNDDAYAKACTAKVTAVHGDAVELDRTVFYAQGGGQPGDTGRLVRADGSAITVANTIKGESPGSVRHLVGGAALTLGEAVTAEIDWPRRHRLMRMHTGLHLLSAVLRYPVTGGQVGDDRGRLDFDIPEANLDKDAITAQLAQLIAADHAVEQTWISDEELAAKPELVKTMAVKPPVGAGRVRLIRIGEHVDVQPCGGTHVRRTSEIGALAVTKIEKKGRLNRRVNLAFVGV